MRMAAPQFQTGMRSRYGRSAGSQYRARIDLAHDDFTGDVWNADTLRAEYLNAGFPGADNRKPHSSMVGDWDNADKERTYYIGSRAAGKMLRGYEKGKQVSETDNPWFRIELELRGTNRIIPWNVLTNPASTSPCLSLPNLAVFRPVRAGNIGQGRQHGLPQDARASAKTVGAVHHSGAGSRAERCRAGNAEAVPPRIPRALRPEELRARAKAGAIPGVKVGQRWVFIDDDLAAFLRSLYPPERVHRSNTAVWRG